MRVLHLVKTADGAAFALRQARVLRDLGVDVHVCLPTAGGRYVDAWHATGATVHRLDVDFPVRQPHRIATRARALASLVRRLKPDVVHSHFVGTTYLMRLALKRFDEVIRVFQVPGPLHLEHPVFRAWDVFSAGRNDVWIGSSQAICRRLLAAGVEPAKVHLSYYGSDFEGSVWDPPTLSSPFVVGNLAYMYPPKRYLGQTKGIKRHELLIAALHRLAGDGGIQGRIGGGQWGTSSTYEKRLRRMAKGSGAHFTGELPPERAASFWDGVHVAAHVPLSENCGGVTEPLLRGIPVVCSRTGGLPEVIHPGVTGVLLDDASPEGLAQATLDVRRDYADHLMMAKRGAALVRDMFDLRRTATEVFEIYRFLLGRRSDRPASFDPAEHLRSAPASTTQL